MKYVLTLTAAALASAAIIAVAAPEGAGGHRQGAMLERIKAADTNGDGLISKEEAKALPMIAKHFDEIDTDGKGQLSPDEVPIFSWKAGHPAGESFPFPSGSIPCECFASIGRA